MDQIQSYASAYKDASERTRAVYIIILSFSVVCLLSFLNSFELGWRKRRVEMVQNVYEHMTRLTTPQLIVGDQPSMSDEAVIEAKSYIHFSKIRTIEEAKILLEIAEKQYADATVIEVPIFGIGIHVNDLGIICGFALFFLMLILKYSLVREQENLRLAWQKGKEDNIQKFTYEILTTSELLHRPKQLNKSRSNFFSRQWVDVPVLLLFVPCIAYTFIAANDVRTFDVGDMLSSIYATIEIVIEIVFFIFLILLAISCFVVARDTRDYWAEMEHSVKQTQLKHS